MEPSIFSLWYASTELYVTNFLSMEYYEKQYKNILSDQQWQHLLQTMMSHQMGEERISLVMNIQTPTLQAPKHVYN